MLEKIEQNRLRQISILHDEKIVTAANRSGLRRKTGDLLEAAFIDLVARLAPEFSLEIGAHEANFSQCIKQKLPNTQCIAFEANPFVYHKYVGSFSEDIEYKHLAISSTEGEVTLHIPVMLNGNAIKQTNPISSVLSRHHKGFKYETAQVQATTLDALCQQLNPAESVAWVDVEGAQQQIINGGERFFSKMLALLIELEHDEVWQGQGVASDVIQALASFGLELLMMDNLADGQYNAIFIRVTEQTAEPAQVVTQRYLRELDKLLCI